MSINGYISAATGNYYETDNGPEHAEDLQVPLRPSDAYDWSDTAGRWVLMHQHGGGVLHATPRRPEPRQAVEPAAIEPERARLSLTLPQLGAVWGVAGGLAVAGYQLTQIVGGMAEIRAGMAEIRASIAAVGGAVQSLDKRVTAIEARHSVEDRGRGP